MNTFKIWMEKREDQLRRIRNFISYSSFDDAPMDLAAKHPDKEMDQRKLAGAIKRFINAPIEQITQAIGSEDDARRLLSYLKGQFDPNMDTKRGWNQTYDQRSDEYPDLKDQDKIEALRRKVWGAFRDR